MYIIDAPRNEQVGKVKSKFTLCTRTLKVYDEKGKTLYKIEAGCCECWTFHIKKDEEIVGEIKKKFAGILKEAFTVSLM